MLWLLVGYMWLFIHRPFEVWPVLGTLHIERAYMIITILYWACAAEKSWTNNRLNTAFLSLAMTILTAALLCPYGGEINQTAEDWLKIAVFYVLVISSIHTEEDLKTLIVMFVGIMGLYMLHSFREYMCGRGVYRMGTWRMVGVDSSLGDPNAFAASVNYGIPMLLPVFVLAKHKWHFAALAGLFLLSCLCVLLTGSRTGFAGLALLFVGVALASKYRWRIAFLLIIVAPLAWFSLSEKLQTRYLTIIDPSLGPANAQVSADSRQEFFAMAVNIWKNNPVFGVGPGHFSIASRTGMQAHTLYGQTIAELGTIGAVVLIYTIVCFLLNFLEGHRIHRAIPPTKDSQFCYLVLLAIFIALLQLLFFGLGGHNLFRYTWLWYGAFAALALKFLHEQQSVHARKFGNTCIIGERTSKLAKSPGNLNDFLVFMPNDNH